MSSSVSVSLHHTCFGTKPSKYEIPVDGFEHLTISKASELLDELLQGKTACNMLLSNGYRNSENALGTHVVFLDFDNSCTLAAFLMRATEYKMVPNFIYSTFGQPVATTLNDAAQPELFISKFRAVYIFDTLMSVEVFKILSHVFFSVFGRHRTNTKGNSVGSIDGASFSVSQAMLGTRPNAYSKVYNEAFISLDHFFLNFDRVWFHGTKYKAQAAERFRVFCLESGYSFDDQWIRTQGHFDEYSYYITQEYSRKRTVGLNQWCLVYSNSEEKTTPEESLAKRSRLAVDHNAHLDDVDLSLYPLWDLFLNNEPMSHAQKLGLISNFVQYRGFETFFLNHYENSWCIANPSPSGRSNRDRTRDWKRTIRWWRDRGHSQQCCSTCDCPCGSQQRHTSMHDFHGGFGAKCIKLPEEPVQLKSVESARVELSDLFLKIYTTAKPGEIHIIKAPTGLGKSHTFLNMELPRTVVSAPSHRLLDELVERYRINGRSCFHYKKRASFSQHEEKFKNIERLQLESIVGALQELIVGPLSELYERTPEEEADLYNALTYINQVQAVRRQNTVFCTHKKAFDLFGNYQTFIFDECPMAEILRDFQVCQRDISKLKQHTDGPLYEFFDRIECCPTDRAILVERPDGFTDKLFINFLKRHREELSQNLLTLLDVYAVRRGACGSVIEAVTKSQELPEDKKIIILSATVDPTVYRHLFGERVIVHEITQVQGAGRVFIHPDKSFTRSSIDGKADEFRTFVLEQVKKWKLDGIITYKHCYRNGRFLDTDILMPTYFGNTEGVNIGQGLNIGIFGTPNKPLDAYGMLACAIQKEVDADFFGAFELCEVEVNGFRTKIYTSANPFVQSLHMAHLNEELTQAVGRARTICNQCDVHLFSRFPVRGGNFA